MCLINSLPTVADPETSERGGKKGGTGVRNMKYKPPRSVDIFLWLFLQVGGGGIVPLPPPPPRIPYWPKARSITRSITLNVLGEH